MLDEGEKEGKCGRQEDQKGERGWSTGEGGKGGREEKTRERDTKKKLIPTHGLWLCASESTCSLSKGQSWSCLPETGGKG